MLIQLKQHIKNHRFVSLFDLTSHFNIEAQILRDMLQLWVRKGKIRERKKTNSCRVKCIKCHPFMTEIYEWID